MNNETMVLASRPTGTPTAAQFQLEKREVPTPEPDRLMLKTLYVSVDSYTRGGAAPGICPRKPPRRSTQHPPKP